MNRHPNAITYTSDEPFEFEQLHMAEVEKINKLEVAYESWGNKNNPAILVCHALTGNSHACGSKNDPGWWQAMVGKGKAIDTDKFYVLCISMLGSCGGTSGPSSINPSTNKPYGLTFPVVTIFDAVQAHKLLLDHLGITKLHAVVGPSMGGFVSLAMSIRYPSFVERSIIVASSPYSNQFMIMTNRAQIDAIQRSLDYNNGIYDPQNPPQAGLTVARMIGFTTFISPITMERKFLKYHKSSRKLLNDAQFHQQMFHEAENYLRRVSEPFANCFDPNSMVYLLQTWNHFDLTMRYGSLKCALEGVKARMLLITATGDNLFPPYLSEALFDAAQQCSIDVQHLSIDDDYGHDFFLKSAVIEERLAQPVINFLEK